MSPSPTSTPSQNTVFEQLLRAHQGGPLADDRALAGHLASEALAYDIQDRLLRALPGGGENVPRHWKSGGPTRTDTMRHAPLPPAGVRASGATLQGLHLRQPERGIEAEVALRLGRDVSPQEAAQLTPESAAALVDAMCVSIEVIDTRWQGGRSAPIALKVADLLVHGALVLGDFMPFASRDWARQSCSVTIGDAPAQTFVGSLGVGDPVWVLPQWLAHVTRHGASVPAGTVVTTGTWCGMLAARPGDLVEVIFAGMGGVNVRV